VSSGGCSAQERGGSRTQTGSVIKKLVPRDIIEVDMGDFGPEGGGGGVLEGVGW